MKTIQSIHQYNQQSIQFILRNILLNNYTLLLFLTLLLYSINTKAAPKPVSNIACQMVGNATDKVRIIWHDTNSGDADHIVERRSTTGNNWSEISTIAADSCDTDCNYTDNDAGDATIYRYRVRADDGNSLSLNNPVCREPQWVDSIDNNYRIFFRFDECPAIEDGQVCTQGPPAAHPFYMAEIFEQYNAEYISLGFKDPSDIKDDKPFPVDLYPCRKVLGGGCSLNGAIWIAPQALEPTDYNPATGSDNIFEYFVTGHEVFHELQNYYGNTVDPFSFWVIEGHARVMEDKVCVFDTEECEIWDNVAVKFYEDAMTNYLGQPEVGLQEQKYEAAIFWVKVAEEFTNITTEPELGSDVIRDFWVTNSSNNPKKDGIETLNDTLENVYGTSRRFIDIFKDFVVANYAKDYISDPVPENFKKYNYIDEETLPTGSYGTVKLTSSGALDIDNTLFGTKSVDAWGARYFEMDPDLSLSVINIDVKTLAATQNQLYFHVLGITGVDDNAQIVYQDSHIGTSYEHSIDNSLPYSRIALVVASLGQQTNFDYGFNLSEGLFIQSPSSQTPANVGESTSPKKFTVHLKVIGNDGEPEAGIDPNDFVVSVEGNQIYPTANPANSPLIAASYIAGQYWLVLRAPAGLACDPCDLTVAYSSFSDIKVNALKYGPVPGIDNMIVIDRSGSMEGEKIEAAKEAGKLYVDAYDTGDKVGVLSYAEKPLNDMPLSPWDATIRITTQSKIDNIAPPEGGTASGAALREGMQLLMNQTQPNPEHTWAMVLLSDGIDSVEDSNDHLTTFIKEYKALKEANVTVPVIHAIAIGDDADGVALENLVNTAGGEFEWLSDVPSAAAAALGTSDNFSTELAEIYRVIAENNNGEQQIFSKRENIPLGISNSVIKVDPAASQAIFVFKWTPATLSQPFVLLRKPNGTVIEPTLTADGHNVWRVPTPDAGDWQMTVDNFGGPFDFLIEASLISDLTLKAFLGLPNEDRQAGRPMPIRALLSDISAIKGASVHANIKKTGESLTLFDDGLHNDGAANDGFYGGTLLKTNQSGGYTVIIDANGQSNLDEAFVRRTRISFNMEGNPDDADHDGLPTWWEMENGLDPNVPNKRDDDPDKDKLTTHQEYIHKTHPLDPDSDDGGENDGSEVRNGSNPLLAGDEFMSPPRAKSWPGVDQVHLRYTNSKQPDGFPPVRTMDIYGAILERNKLIKPFKLVANVPANSLQWTDNITKNWGFQQPGTTYCYCVIAKGEGESAPSDVTCSTPSSDPYPPHGSIRIAPINVANLPVLTLSLLASDNPMTAEDIAFGGALIDKDSVPSGVNKMMLSNRADFADAQWQPYQESLDWQASFDANGKAHVFVKFLDTAGNESWLVSTSIQTDEMIDSDKDGIPDNVDNCPLTANATQENSDSDSHGNVCDNCTDMTNEAQRDTDHDNIGNFCDADFNNNCIVDASDFSYLKGKIFTTDKDADLNGNGIVDAADFTALKNWIFHVPGPSGFGLCQ